MPSPADVAERLGFDPDGAEQVARYKALGARGALRTFDADAAGSPQQLARVDYLTTQAFRALGLLALFDPQEARDLGDELLWRLAEVGHPSWPLALALADLTDKQRRIPDLFDAPGGFPTDLAWLLIDPAQPLDEHRPLRRREHRRYGRGGLAPYRIDVRVLSAVARGGNTTDLGYVSEPSAPAVVGALFGSLEDALAEARLDEQHWRIGAAPISPTDPEVLLAVRIVLRSPSGWALRSAQREDEIPMIGAVVDLLDSIARL